MQSKKQSIIGNGNKNKYRSTFAIILKHLHLYGQTLFTGNLRLSD